MSIRLPDRLQRDTREAADFAKALEQIKPQCDLLDPDSVLDALLQIDRQVNREAQAYPDNEMVKVLAKGAKLAMRSSLGEEARKAQARS